MPLTDGQKKIKALNKIASLELEESLGNLKAKIDGLFNDAPIAAAEANSKKELAELISAIKKGTATNLKITRFLDIAQALGL